MTRRSVFLTEHRVPAVPDCFTTIQRSAVMKAVRTKHTAPELLLRASLRSIGLRYRLHPKNVPGRPDLVIAKSRIAVFVDGCFWHGCPRCYTAPQTNSPFWRRKLEANKARRLRVKALLRSAGWRYFHAWECEVERNANRIGLRLKAKINQLSENVLEETNRR